MIKRPKPERFRLRRTMMFMNAQKPTDLCSRSTEFTLRT